MQHDIAAIKDGFPEGVWPSALLWFLLERRYLTVVFQKDDDFLKTNKVHERSSIKRQCLRGGIYNRQGKNKSISLSL